MNSTQRFLFIFVICFYLFLSCLYLFCGTIHLDEGAYLYASRAVYHHQLPYRDFFFLQPPVYPYVYGFFQLFAPGFLTARLTSVVLGLLSALFLAGTAYKLGSRNAAFITLVLIASNSFQIYFFTITRLYALTCFFLSIGWYLIASYRRPGWVPSAFITICFTLAVATRLTTLPILLLAFLYLLFTGKTIPAKILPVGISIAFLAAIFSPFILSMPLSQLWFNLLGMNLSLHSHNPVASLVQKASATSHLIRFYFLILLMAGALILSVLTHRDNRRLKTIHRFSTTPLGILWIMAASVFLAHTTAKIYQVSYQTIIMPLIACLVAVYWDGVMKNSSRPVRNILRTVFLVGAVLTPLSYGKSSIRFIDGKPAYFALKAQTDLVESLCGKDELVFTADSALVPTNANRNILPGMAGSDLFPDWSTQKCNAFHVLNFEIMTKYVRGERAKVLIHGDRSFSLSLPYLEPISQGTREAFLREIKSHYRLVKTTPNLFIPSSKTYYYIRKESSP